MVKSITDPKDIGEFKLFTKNNMEKTKYNKKELKIGRCIEMEHTKSKKVAERIAKDHLKEFPMYYAKGVLPMEIRLKKLVKKNKFKIKLKGGRN